MAVLVDPAIDILAKVLRPGRGQTISPALQFAVARDVLDRAGLKHVGTAHVAVAVSKIDLRELTDEQLQAILKLRERLTGHVFP